MDGLLTFNVNQLFITYATISVSIFIRYAHENMKQKLKSRILIAKLHKF